MSWQLSSTFIDCCMYSDLSFSTMRRHQLIVVVFLVMIANPNFTEAAITVKNNGYEGIVVAFSPNIAEDVGLPLIRNVQELFVNGSKLLYKSTRRKLYFGKITILVPETWEKKAEYLPATWEIYGLADVRIDDPNPALGDCPYTLQHMGCGHQGRYIHFTHRYLTNLKTSSTRLFGAPDKILVHEWAHYRYGVFDEYGYPGHDRYPMFYVDPNSEKLVPNYCANAEIIGRYRNVVDDEPCRYNENGIPDANCIFVPSTDGFDRVETSLTSYFHGRNVEYFCNETNHNPYAPNRHNDLCDQKSAWQVVSAHPDLVTARPTDLDPSTTTFKIVQPTETTIVLVLDVSGSMGFEFNEKTKYTKLEMLRDTLKRWINHEVELGWSIGIVSFEKYVKVDLLPIKVTDDSVRTLICDRIPKRADGGTCIGCGLAKAIEILRQHRRGGLGGTIILVSDGEESFELGVKTVKDVMQSLRESRVRVVSIVFTQKASRTLERVAKETNGKTYLVSYKTGIEAMTSALLETAALLEKSVDNKVKVAQVQFRDTRKKHLNGSFVIDRTIGERVAISFSYQRINVIATITVANSSNDVIAFVDAASSNTRHWPPEIFVSNDSNSFRLVFQHLEPGFYDYSVRTGSSNNNDGVIDVNVDASSASSKPIVAKCWFEVENEKRLVVFASVEQGSSPVVAATVTAHIERPDETTVAIRLLDSGTGADVVRDDGIYSKYFTKFVNDSGRYTVKATVRGNHLSSIRKTSFFGSRIPPIAADQTHGEIRSSDVPTGSFERTSNGGSFDLPANFTAADTIPPVKVYDLRLINVSTDGLVFLRWTAPGDDLDEGTVTKYDVRYSDDFHRLSVHFNATELLDTSRLAPVESGKMQTFGGKIMRSLLTRSVVYLALKSADDVSNWSKMSNVVTIISPLVSKLNKDASPPQPNKPNEKIRDLRLVRVDANNTVHIQWTAPGNRVHEYDIRYSEEIGAIANHLEGRRAIGDEEITLVRPGRTQSFAFVLARLSTTTNFYLALRAGDNFLNWSHISNVIIVRKPIATPYHMPLSVKFLIVIIISLLLAFIVLNIIVYGISDLSYFTPK